MKTDLTPPFLLDTHVWFWFVNGDLASQFKSIDRQIQDRTNQGCVLVAGISMWEIAMLESKGRIQTPPHCLGWIKRALDAPGIELEDLTPEVAVASTRLPGTPPRDPSDRVILASAMDIGAILVSRDREMISYCEANELPCLAF